MSAIADTILSVESLKAERAAKFDHLVTVLAEGEVEVDAVEVDQIVHDARRSMRDLANAVDRAVSRRRAAELLTTAPAAEAAQRAAMDRRDTVTATADARVAKLRQEQAAALAAAAAERELEVAAAERELEVAAAAVAEVESAHMHLRTTAAPELRTHLADLHYERDRVLAEIEQRRQQIAEAQRLLVIHRPAPARNEETHPRGDTQLGAERARADEDRARAQANEIVARETARAEGCRRGINVFQERLHEIDAEIRAAEAALLLP